MFSLNLESAMAKENTFPQFFSVNLSGGTNCQTAIELYQSLLGGEIKYQSVVHSELILPEGNLLIFSTESEDCPVRPGTFTVRITKDHNFNFPNEFQKIRAPHHKKYELWEDLNGNWIWVYYFDSK